MPVKKQLTVKTEPDNSICGNRENQLLAKCLIRMAEEWCDSKFLTPPNC